MKEYDLYVPLYSDQGIAFSHVRLEQLKKRLIKRFGGLTHFPQHNQGFWKLGNVMFRDEIVILRVLSGGDRKAETFWKALKTELRRRWRQKDILIVVREVNIV